MSSESREPHASTGGYWKEIGFAWLDLALFTLVYFALRFILVRFSWFQRFDAAHRFLAFLVPVLALSLAFSLLYRRKAQRRELPIALALSLLTPSFFYRRLDRLAGPDD